MASGSKGRGRLSAIEQLPDEAEPFVIAAIKALNARERTQESIREELNLNLLAIGADPISPSSFNRYSLNLAVQGKRLMQAREIAEIFSEKINEQPDGDIGLLLVETIKTLIYDVVIDASLSGESPSIELLETAAKALKDLELGRGANLRVAKLKQDNFITQAADTVEAAAQEAGLSKERVAQLRRDVLGVRSK